MANVGGYQILNKKLILLKAKHFKICIARVTFCNAIKIRTTVKRNLIKTNLPIFFSLYGFQNANTCAITLITYL